MNWLVNLLVINILAIFCIILHSRTSKNSSNFLGLFFSILIFLCSLTLWIFFNKLTDKFQFIFQYKYIQIFNTPVLLGIDGISVFFILLTTFIIPLCLLSSWNLIQRAEYIVYILSLELFLILSFSVLDLLLFFIFFESILIPMFLIVGIWGMHERRIWASLLLFIYTLTGSLFLLFSITILYMELNSTNYYVLLYNDISGHKQLLLWLFIFLGFSVKIPMFPFHIWLPEAHVEAPTTGSVILASLLLKLGGYGFLRFLIPILPKALEFFLPLVYTLSILGIIYASLTTIRQVDLKRIIAYSSVAHMNIVVLGIFSGTIQGIQGAILLMLAHGLVSGALFLCIGVLYNRYHTRMVNYFGGLTQVMPIFSTIFLFFSLSNSSMPGTFNFVGEILIFLGVFQQSTIICLLALFSIVLGAVYSLWLFNRICFGTLKTNSISFFIDINKKEFFIFLPLVFLTLLFGIFPDCILSTTCCSVQVLWLFTLV